MDGNTAIAVFGGGCFWCTEAVFEQLRGVIAVMPGYAGGTVPNPTYRQVGGGKTGHAEVIRVVYDSAQITYDDLLTVFFATHDPTTLNRQGADVGTEYRSVILYANEEQKCEALAFIRELSTSDAPGSRIVTEVNPLTTFYEAEEYHREYYRTNSAAPYCQYVINPKLEKLHKKFRALLKPSGAEPGLKVGDAR